MTLIATSISKYGIIQASDSNLTSVSDLSVRAGQKVFDLPFARASLAVAGKYSVGNQRMDTWMIECIDRYSKSGAPSVPEFTEHLRARLSKELTSDERKSLTLIHVAGYVEASGEAHPEMHLWQKSQRQGN